MPQPPTIDDHRLLDGFLARVATDPESGAFALRGGMLVRHWFTPMGRLARDADLLCAWPYDLRVVRRGLARILARDLGDGVRFAECFRTDRIWPDDVHPGIRVMAPASFDGRWSEIRADLTFHLPAWPDAVFTSLGADRPALPMCRPETLVARKLGVTAGLGPRGWRPKDLVDVWWILESGRARLDIVAEAVDRTLSLELWVDGPARRSFWQDPMAAGRWARFLRRSPRLRVPGDLGRLVHDVHRHLASLGGP